MRDAASGAISRAELEQVQDRAVLEAIALQEACGLDVITDGEMRRRSWSDPLTRGIAGYSRDALAPVPFTAGQAPAEAGPRLPAVVERLRPGTNLPLRET